MNLLRRQISLLLALVIIFTTAINGVVVACMSGSDHQAIESIGHQLGLLDHSIDPIVFTEHSHDHEVHPESCVDSSLLSDTVIQRDNSSFSWEEPKLQVFLVYTFADLLTPDVAHIPHSWSIPLNSQGLHPVIDGLSTIRLLI